MHDTERRSKSPRPRAFALAGLSLALGLLPACQGTLAGDRVPPHADALCTDRIVLGTAPLRRLSNGEYLRTLAVLFDELPELPDLPDDTTVLGFENDAVSLGPTDVRVARYEDIAFRTTSVATDATHLADFTGCGEVSTDAEERACGTDFVARFGLLTHRRPLTSDETTLYTSLFETQRAAIDFAAAVQLTAMAMLQSPAFLYRLEIEGAEAAPVTEGQALALTPYEVATRLSYLLWGTMPDEELFAAAASGELGDSESLELQARRMLEDPRARDLVADFHRQWLDFDRILNAEHATRVNDAEGVYTSDAQASAREELMRFVAGEVFDGEGTLAGLFTSRRAYVNSTMAGLYGVSGPSSATEWTEVQLPEDERAGLLTRVAPLASHAHAANPSPPLRGVYLMERVLCEPRLSPPPGVNTTQPTQPDDGPRTNRDLFTERTSPATCQSCHIRIDGYGFLAENYDERGVYRTEDHTLPVDATGRISGTDVDGPVDGLIELSERFADSESVAVCATSRWFRFVNGRAPEDADDCLLEGIRSTFDASGGDIRELLVAFVTRPEFRLRPVITEE